MFNYGDTEQNALVVLEARGAGPTPYSPAVVPTSVLYATTSSASS